MFCYKCGTELADGAAFCHKCGAKMAAKDMNKTVPEQQNIPARAALEQPNFAAKPALEQQRQTDTHPGAPKKKSRKLPVILGVVVLLIVAAFVYLGVKDHDDSGKMTELTETFTSEPDAFSFRYPKAWKMVESDDESVVVRLGNADIYSFIYIRKFTDRPAVADDLYNMDEESFLEDFGTGDNVVKSYSIVNLNGFPAREVDYSTPDSNVGTVYYRTYLYAFDSVLYRVDLVKKEINPIDVDRVFDAIMDSYTITAEPDEDRSENAESAQTWIYSWQSGTDTNQDAGEKDVAYKEAYAGKVRELAAEDDTAHFALIDLTGSDIPELAVDYYGYGVSVFTWVDGEIIPLMDFWPYGAGGNMGYEYLPGQNVIRNVSLGQAGAVIYESYMTVNAACEIVSLLDEELSICNFTDSNKNHWMDEDETYSEDPVYYYGDTQISEEEYASYQINGDYEQITGDMSAEEILAKLDESDMTSGYLSDGALPVWNEPIESYYELSGAYSGTMEASTVSLSIYTSQEEGETAIGTAQIYAEGGKYYYFGEILPIEKDVYKVVTDTGEVILTASGSAGSIVLQLYVDGQYIEEYRMKEHYES